MPESNPTQRIVAEVHMFDTCTLKCGYCWFAESGQVLDTIVWEGVPVVVEGW